MESIAYCGPRVSDLAGLAIKDVDRTGDDPMLRISARAGGGKRRAVPIPSRTSPALTPTRRHAPASPSPGSAVTALFAAFAPLVR
jgi:integrase